MTRRLLIIALVFATSSTLASAQELAKVLERAAPAVVRVEARTCRVGNQFGDGRTATGFVWHDSSTIVTALHVIAGCSNVVVSYQAKENNGTIDRAASVTKVLREADLVLLKITNAPQVQPLMVAQKYPQLEEKLQALGYPLQIPKMRNTPLSLDFGGKQLKDIVPQTIKDSLDIDKSPNPDTEITSIYGFLLPGLSGSPILNSGGELVAIGDGGLENGAAGISWGIPARKLATLLSSSDNSSTILQKPLNKVLFAVESQAKVMGSVNCSGVQLTKIREASFRQIAPSTDDPLGLQQLINFFGANPDALSFDIYQDLSSGGTIVVPSGVAVVSGAKGCTAELNNGNFTMKIQFVTINNEGEIQPKSTEAEEQSVDGSLQGWVLDPAFTNVLAQVRFDKLIVRRKAFVHLDANLIAPNTIPQDKYLFETIATRGPVLINVSALNKIATVDNNKIAIQCRQMPNNDGCSMINKRSDDWVRLVISVHLATFPIG